MNIELKSEDIEKLVEKEIKEKVRSWFSSADARMYLEREVKNQIDNEVSRRVDEYCGNMTEVVEKLQKDRLSDRIVDNIGYQIARIFCDKYSGF